MKMYYLEDYMTLPQGAHMWVQFHRDDDWMPCVITVELVGIEHRVEVHCIGGSTSFWPEDPTMFEEGFAKMRFWGPLEQPVIPDDQD